MKKNQLTTTKSTAVILGKTKSLMNITKKILERNNKDLAKTNKELITHEDITIIGNLMWGKESRKMTWNEAMEYATNLKLGGYNDWRLPTVDELFGVVTLCGGIATTYSDNLYEASNKNEANKNYQANYKVEGFLSNRYWSSSTFNEYSIDTWVVNFHNGGQGNLYEWDKYYVRCVRLGH